MPTKIANASSGPSDDATKACTATAVEEGKKYFKAAIKRTDEEGNEIPEEPAAAIGLLPDIASDAKQWEWAGVSFGDYDLMLLQKNLK